MKIEVLVGMIGSGKSTYARERADEGALVINHDDLTTMLHARYHYEAELKPCYRAMMVQIATNAIVANRDVVIDRTHLTRESRKVWIEVGRGACVPVIAVRFPMVSAEEHARRRFECDPRGRSLDEWLMVARHHAEQAAAEPLEWLAEGFDGMQRIRGEQPS